MKQFATILFLLTGSLYSYMLPGQITFQRVFADAFDQAGLAVKECLDTGYIIAGVNLSNASYNMMVLRTDPHGNIIWKKKIPYPETSGFDIVQTSDGHFTICSFQGSSSPSTFMVHLDAEGKELWSEHGCAGWEQSLQEVATGGFISAGANVILRDEHGEEIWCRDLEYQAFYLAEATDSSYIISGCNYDKDSVYIEERDIEGNRKWIKAFYGSYINSSNNILDKAGMDTFIVAFNDLSGKTTILLFDHAGEILSLNQVENLSVTCIKVTYDHGYALGGFKYSECGLLLLKFDASGTLQWQREYCAPMMNHAPFYFPHVKSIRETLDKGFIMTGICGSAEGDYELMLLKTDSLGMILSTGTEDIMLPAERHELINVVPNPFQNYTTLSSNELTEDATLQVYDMNGLLMKVAYTIVENKIQLDCSGLPAGLYFATIFAHNSSRFTTKIIILE